MSEDPCNIGIMHPAFQVSKSVLLAWLNEFFELNYKKVEECATGAVYCQICDCLFSKVPMGRVDWGAKSEYAYVQNFKIAQKCFSENSIQKSIPIEKLVKAKFQDNLEFLQWIKHFFDCKYNGADYDAVGRRAKGKGFSGLAKSGGVSMPKKTTSTKTATKTTTKRAPVKKAAPSGGGGEGGGASDVKALQAEIGDLTNQIAQLTATAEGLETERNFYFGKLREVEILCQDEEAEVTKEKILEILYQTDEPAEGEDGGEGGGEGGEGGGEAEADDDETF